MKVFIYLSLFLAVFAQISDAEDLRSALTSLKNESNLEIISYIKGKLIERYFLYFFIFKAQMKPSVWMLLHRYDILMNMISRHQRKNSRLHQAQRLNAMHLKNEKINKEEKAEKYKYLFKSFK